MGPSSAPCACSSEGVGAGGREPKEKGWGERQIYQIGASVMSVCAMRSLREQESFSIEQIHFCRTLSLRAAEESSGSGGKRLQAHCTAWNPLGNG